MTAAVCDLNPVECSNLVNFLFDCSGGHLLHTLQLLRVFLSNKVVSIAMGALLFDENKATEILREAGRDALHLVSDLICGLPASTQDWLSTAAFLGTEFDDDVVQIAMDKNSIGDAENALEAGLITHARGKTGCSDRFRFVHDTVQQASYELIRQDQSQLLHFNVGMRM